MPQGHDGANAHASDRQPQSLRAMAEAMKKKSAEKATQPAPVPSAPASVPMPLSAPVSAPVSAAPVSAPVPPSGPVSAPVSAAPQSAPSAPHTLPSAAPVAAAAPPPPPKSAAPTSIAPVTSDVASVPPSAMPMGAPHQPPAQKKGNRGLVAVGAIAGLALLAGVGVFGAQMLKGETAVAAADPVVEEVAENAAGKSSKGFVVEADEEPSGGVDLGALPDADAEEEDVEEAAPAVGGPLPAVADADEEDVDEDDGPTRGPKGDLDEGLSDAAGDVDMSTEEVDMEKAGKRTHVIPKFPPQGAVAAGVRPGRMAAKACVAGADGVTRVQLSFQSSGAVTSISVGGWAAKNGKAGCVKAAFQGVNVGQFQDPSYSFPVSVRP